MTWQPIESAPKDGTHVLLFLPLLRLQVWIGHFVDTETFDYGKSTRKRQYWSIGSMVMLGVDPAPTHWQPLPAPPVQP